MKTKIRAISARTCMLTVVGLGLLCMMAAVPAETLLVVRKSADALDFVDPGSGLRLASVALGHAPHEVSVSPDGRLAVVSNYGTKERPGSSVSIVDLEQPRELRRIDLAPHTRPHGVDWYAADRVAVTAEGSRSLLLVDPLAGRVVAAVATDQDVSHMVDVSPDGRHAWVANIGSGSVSAIDLDGDRMTLRGAVPTGKGTEAIAVRPQGTSVWAAARAEGAVVALDAAALAVAQRWELPGVPIRLAFAPDGSRAYLTRAGAGDVVALDAATGAIVAQRKIDVPLAPDAAQRPFAGLAPGSPLPVGLLVAPDGRSLYVAATMADRVVQVDARNFIVLRSIEVGGEPDGLAVTTVMPKKPCHACVQE
jgi:DNA-binding beta-propeller fold protein YncE